MNARQMLSWLIVLVGLVLAATPWLLRFTSDRVASLDVTVGGVIVALLALALAYGTTPAPADRRLSH
jgi:hypothetical protein